MPRLEDARALAESLMGDAVYAKDRTQMQTRTSNAIQFGREALIRLLMAMPIEPVGRGAHWKVVRPIERGAAIYLETMDVELVAVKKNLLTLKLIFTGQSEPLGPYMGSDSLSMVGGGSATVDLNRVLPVAYQDRLEVKIRSGKASSRAVMSVKAGLVP